MTTLGDPIIGHEGQEPRRKPPEDWRPETGEIVEIIDGPYYDLIGVVREQVWPESWAVDLGYSTPLVFDLAQMRHWEDA